jgi:hypothetical protein
MRASPLAVALSLVSAAACAQPANNASESMETCFRSARAADAICSDPANDPVKRLDCLDKARAAQLDCLNKVLASPPAGSVSSETPPPAGPPDMPTVTVPQPAPAENHEPETPTAEVPPDRRPEAAPPDRLPTGSVSPEPAGPVDTPASQSSNWVISETTSPLDYSPLIAAVARSTSQEKDAPTSLVVRCRGQRAEVSVGTQGTWRGSRSHQVQVDYQVDDRPVVRQLWIASEDGKAVRYTDDVFGLLRSLPDDARLKIRVFDWQGGSHEATFQLAGLDAVRKKIEPACQPTLTGDGASPTAHTIGGESRRDHPDRGEDGEYSHFRSAAARTGPTVERKSHTTRGASTSRSGSR